MYSNGLFYQSLTVFVYKTIYTVISQFHNNVGNVNRIVNFCIIVQALIVLWTWSFLRQRSPNHVLLVQDLLQLR